jgi:hypothetical protein
VCKFYFVVEVGGEQIATNGRPQVLLDPNEHAGHTWATEQEIRDGFMVAGGETGDGLKLEFTTAEQRAVVLEAFKLCGNGGVDAAEPR